MTRRALRSSSMIAAIARLIRLSTVPISEHSRAGFGRFCALTSTCGLALSKSKQYGLHVDTRSSSERAAANVRGAILSSGADSSVIAIAVGMEPEDLRARLLPSPEEPFKVTELLRVGGVLRVPADEFLGGVA